MNSTFLEPSDTASHVVREGRDFEIKCHPPAGKPPPVIRWTAPNGDVVTPIGRVRVDGRTLQVIGANAQVDAGRYTCRAENLAGLREVSFNLTVAGECRVGDEKRYSIHLAQENEPGIWEK